MDVEQIGRSLPNAYREAILSMTDENAEAIERMAREG